MTPFKPYFIVKRVLISARGKSVYDQTFSSGVNIIRGDNGTGKSTVMDLLFFALGGDVKDWTEEQSRCDYVMCEVNLSGKVVTLRREISSSTSMYVYEGELDPNAPISKFLQLPYRVSERKESFSQTLFDYLGLPRYQKNDSTTLTMHQILRLIYVDQITPPNKILRQEPPNSDGHSNRLAIGEYMLGIDDLESHHLRQDKSRLEKQSEALVTERNAIYRVLGRHSVGVDEEKITEEIHELEHEKTVLQKSLATVKKDGLPGDLVKSLEAMSAKVADQKELLLSLQNERARLSDEVIDAQLFIDSLAFRLRSIDEAAEVWNEIGNMEFKFCPSCLSPITPSSNHSVCGLCKTANAFDRKGNGYLAEKTSLNFQLAESTEILEGSKRKLSKIEREISAARTQLGLLLDNYRPVGETLRADDPKYYENAVRLGFIEKQLEQLRDNLNIVKEVEKTNQKLAHFIQQIETIEAKLQAAIQRTAGRREDVAENISTLVVEILKRDLGYEIAFENAEEFDYDFGLDRMRLDGRSKFSASSMTLLKNAFRFAIFYLSVQDKGMRYPRLLIMDNIEDKGMVPARSQNFQRLLVEYCSRLSGEYQLIFSTSMIDPVLNQSDLCRGINYLKGQHTLSF